MSKVFLCDVSKKQNIFVGSLQVISVHHPGLECREFPFIVGPAVTYRNNEDKLRRECERSPDVRGKQDRSREVGGWVEMREKQERDA